MARIIICKECGEEKKHHAHGLCTLCYFKHWQPRIITCLSCGKERKHASHGLCNACYLLQLRADGKCLMPIKACGECGELKRIQGRKLCARCYQRLRVQEDPTYRNRQATYNHHYRAKGMLPLVICVQCGKEKTHKAHGLCRACYERWYLKRNPARAKAHYTKRKARRRGYDANLSPEDIEELLEIGRNSYPGEELHIDHIVPLNRGGNSTRANVHAIPAWLNLSKGNKLPEEAYKQIALL